MATAWLLDQHPLVTDKRLATAIGLHEAIALQQINYWLHAKGGKDAEGRHWIKHPIAEFKTKDFPFWSVSTIKRTLNSLQRKKLLLVSDLNSAGFDKTNWYTIDDNMVNKIMKKWMNRRSVQNEPTMGSKRTNGTVQNEPTNNREYTENTSEINNNNNAAAKSGPQNQPTKSELLNQEATEIIKYLNKTTGHRFRPTTEANRKPIKARLREGFTVANARTVINKKFQDWHGVRFGGNGELGDNYLTPQTLFRASNFERYLQETPRVTGNYIGGGPSNDVEGVPSSTEDMETNLKRLQAQQAARKKR